MKKLSLPAILILLFLFVSCQDKYIMPHTPGVTVDTEAFELYKNLWNSCGIKNYSYTYTLNRYPPLNFVVDVTVTNGDISYDLKEYNQLKDSEITEIDKHLPTIIATVKPTIQALLYKTLFVPPVI